jgi:hypothetical protein
MTSLEILAGDPSASGTGNADYQWSKFDSEAYFQHYYGEPHPDDDIVVRSAARALMGAKLPRGVLDIVDVGTGPNLIPFFCSLPFARRLTAWEYSESNVEWLKGELASPLLRPQWKHFWTTTCESYGGAYALPPSPLPRLKSIASIVRGSIFDLPRHTWDAATMFFCAESITGKRNEFDDACAAFARSVRPGGTLAAAFLVCSAGYEIAGRKFPVLHLTAETIEDAFKSHATDVRAERIGIVEREIRSGYSGFIFLTGRARP